MYRKERHEKQKTVEKILKSVVRQRYGKGGKKEKKT